MVVGTNCYHTSSITYRYNSRKHQKYPKIQTFRVRINEDELRKHASRDPIRMQLGGSLSYSKNDVLERSPERLERWGPLLKKTKRAAARPAARPHTGAFYHLRDRVTNCATKCTRCVAMHRVYYG